MSVLTQVLRRAPGLLAHLERTAAESFLPQLQTFAAAPTADFSTLVQQFAMQQQCTTALQGTAPWGSSNWRCCAAAQSSTHALQSVRQYSQCDCPTLGGPTPDVVVVEYDDDEVDRFIALADAIEAAFPNVVVEGNPDGPGRPGSFEIKGQTGQMLFSRLSNGGWPDTEVVVDALAAEAACNTTSAEQKA